MPRPTLARSIMLLALGASVALGACRDWASYDPRIGGGGSGGSSGSSGSSSSSSSVGGGGGGDSGVACSLPLMDTFNAQAIGNLWGKQTNAGGLISVANQKLVLTLPNTMAGSGAYIVSTSSYDLTGCRGSVSLSQLPSLTTKALALFALQYDVDNSIVLLESEGNLQAKKRITGGETIVKTIPYNPVDHAYLGISELGGEVRWEASPDGKTWTILAHEPNWLPSSKVHLKIGSSTYQVEPSAPGETHFDDVDIVP
ncbi:MAG: hypothetical protein ABJE95_31475 [Byssovorax sp.]